MSDNSVACRACGAVNLVPVLDLGRTPLANALLTRTQLEDPERMYALKLVFCPFCTLAQITETVPPEGLFREYVYFSSYSDTALRNAQALAERLVPARGLGSDSMVAEIASNDGYLLQYYRQRGIPVLGIEPARNIAQAAEKRGIRTIPEFFGKTLALQLAEQGQRVDVVHANNVLAHVADLNGVVEGIGLLLKDNGVAIIEVPYVKNLIEQVQFDTVYHEHLCYFSLTALDRLFKRHELMVIDVEHIAIHGGSLRIFVQHAAGANRNQAVERFLCEESASSMDHASYYRNFCVRVQQLRGNLMSLLVDLRRRGRRVAAYGASAKGSTLLNYCGIGPDILDFVVDRSTVKQGLYTPGTHLPIYAPEKLLEAMPDYVLLLTWNFADEIMDQQAEYRQRGGHFIIPVPSVRVV